MELPFERRERGADTWRADAVLSTASDLGMAAWLVAAEQAGDRVHTFGPNGFDAYARLRYIPDPITVDQSEADVRLPADHRSDLEQATRALRVMTHYTTTPEHCFFAVWVGDLSNRTHDRWSGMPHLVLRVGPTSCCRGR